MRSGAGAKKRPRAGVGAHEERHALEGQEAADEEEDGRRPAAVWVDECLESGRRVANASGPARVVPALRVVDEPAAQEDEALLEAELAAVEALGVHAVRDHLDRLGRHAEQAQRLVTVVGRDADQTVTATGGRAQALRPVVAEAPEHPASARQPPDSAVGCQNRVPPANPHFSGTAHRILTPHTVTIATNDERRPLRRSRHRRSARWSSAAPPRRHDARSRAASDAAGG